MRTITNKFKSSFTILITVEDKTYNQLKGKLEKGSFEDCTFTNCNFNEQDLSGFIFNDCEFIECNLSNCSLGDTAFKNVVLKNCKLLGLQFSHCSTFLFKINFNNSVIDYSSFDVFDQTNLTKCDLSTSTNININPHNNILNKTKFSIHNISQIAENIGITLV